MPALPDTASSPLLVPLLVTESLLLLFGLGLLIARRRLLLPRFLGAPPAPLPPSEFRPTELFLAIAFAFGGAVVFQVATAFACQRFLPSHEPGGGGISGILSGAGFQIGLLAGLGHVWFWHLRPDRRPPPLTPTPPHPELSLARILRGGFFTFLIGLLVVVPSAILWQSFIKWCGVDAPPQDLVTLFREINDPFSLVLLIGMVVLLAPLTEELAFRVGLFRWLRGRAPRAIALLLPAIVFAGVHGYVSAFGPLAALAVVLALGYEHYGHPAVPMLAHALFNLNSVALLLAGISA